MDDDQDHYGDGKFWIKLKFPKIEEPNPIEAKLDDDDHVRVCEFCNRGFSSGKALGGHMRVHVQENRGDLIKINKNPIKINRSLIEKSQHLESLSEKPNCSLCGKGFPSLKSLFGHMRCHPERGYRGIQPPQTGPNHLSSSSSVSDELESTNPAFLRWSTKAKRGRRSLISAATSSSSAEYGLSEEDIEVVHDLMMLAQGESFSPDLASKSKIEAMDSDSLTIGAEIGYKDQVFESNKRRIEDLGYGSMGKNLKINETVSFEAIGKGKALFGSSENSFSDDEFGKKSDGSVSSDELIISCVRSNKKNSIAKRLKFRDLKLVKNEGDNKDDDNNNVVEKAPLVKYKCSTCNKCFPSHQALGGHRSSHNKFKNTNQALASELASPPKLDDSPPVSRGDDTKESNTTNIVPFRSVPAHQCTICHKIFPTGQALGGHKRCHWAGPTEGPLSSHATSSPREEASRTEVLGFDLNELPLMEDDDCGVESHNADGLLLYGYAS